MSGVEILDQYIIYNSYNFVPEWVAIIAVCVAAIFGIMFLVLIANGKGFSAIVCIILCAVLCVGSIISLSPNKNSISHFEYDVTVDDSVHMNEFMEFYEIIDQHGKIIRVRSKQ